MSYPDMGSPMDPSEHESHNVPQATEHYAGDVIQFPISMQQSDYTRKAREEFKAATGRNLGSSVGNGPAKILRGPGSND